MGVASTLTLDQVYRIIQRHTTCEERLLGMERSISAAAEIYGLIVSQCETIRKQQEIIEGFRETQIQIQLSMMTSLTSDERNQSAWEGYRKSINLLSQSV